MAAVLERTTFKTKREMDFFSEKELTTQTGHPIEEWPCVFLKEGVDNALDACEEADIAPVIKVHVDESGITVTDNGPGLPDATLEGALDFTVRASNREMYVAPDRGAQGNALMTLLAMPHVVDPVHGKLVVTARGVRHAIVCRADPISQRAIVQDDPTDVGETTGTTIRIEWGPQTDDEGEVLWPFGEMRPLDRDAWFRPVATVFDDMVAGYAIFNPHTHISIDWFGTITEFEPTNVDWKKWTPNKPTSAHWYENRHFERLIAAYITYDRNNGNDRTVAELVQEFDGLSGSQKRTKVLDECDLKRVSLSELATTDGLRLDLIGKLLTSMKSHTKPVTVRRLGVIGRDHIESRLISLGCVPESITYRKVTRVDDGMPVVLESAFGWLGEDASDRRRIAAGLRYGFVPDFARFT